MKGEEHRKEAQNFPEILRNSGHPADKLRGSKGGEEVLGLEDVFTTFPEKKQKALQTIIKLTF